MLLAQGQEDIAKEYLKTPTDILRYLWFEKTGYAQIIEPKTLILHARKLYSHMWGPLSQGAKASLEMKNRLKLKYDRKMCRRVAIWLNELQMSAQQVAEQMHPKRGMWVRMIRELRLGEYSRMKGFEHLAEILDVFYNQKYEIWQGAVNKAIKQNNEIETLRLLQERPGLFARCLLATMLRFDSERVVEAFDAMADKLPSRLLVSLANVAESYFDPNSIRLVRPITGVVQQIEPNKLLALYDDDSRRRMIESVQQLYTSAMRKRFAEQEIEAKSIYIDPVLYDIPIGVGDRSTLIQDTSCALMGTRFPIEGDNIRLFMHWGKGLKAQHLDMDLSCRITFQDKDSVECAFYNLNCVGAKHSGDIRSIPNMVGTAEYIELSLDELRDANAKYVVFACNAYSVGALSSNLVVGWMDSKYAMKISETKGVAYDPSCVQHMVRISENNLSKGLVFGVIDVENNEIIWFEMSFTSQILRSLDTESVEAMICKLRSKLMIGELLKLKAEAQNLVLMDNEQDADEVYTYNWALNPADVAALLYM